MKMLLAALLALTLTSCSPATESDNPPERITEDDPRWDCETMGNRTCGTN